MMPINATKLRLTVLLLLSMFAVSMLGSSAQAAEADWLAHRAIRGKLKREAGDRYGIKFLTTHIDRLPGGRRTVTGKGVFNRRGKSPQYFTYHSTVNIVNNSDKETGYDITPM